MLPSTPNDPRPPDRPPPELSDTPPLTDRDIPWDRWQGEDWGEHGPLKGMTPHARAALITSMRTGQPARPVDPAVSESMTDASHAERFAFAFGSELRFDHRRDRWLVYEAQRWKPDIDGGVYRMAIQFARLRQMEAIDIADRKLREAVLKYFIGRESKTALDRCVQLAKFLPPIADNGETWDLDPWLLGAPNGIVNLKDGTMRDGDPADHITMSVSVKYDPAALCPRWRQFVSEIFDNDQELADFVQRFSGYAITGITHEQILAFFYGRGANGKGTFMNTIAHVLGDYAYNMPFSTVELRQRSAIPNDVAALEKRRWVTASETQDGTRLNEARIKALTGCDPITARFLHGEWFTFQPVAKFILSVNHKPTVADDSYGFWRRIRLVPFLRTFIGEQCDPLLESVFREQEAPGILNWCVEGCLTWQRDGLKPPISVVNATSQYRDDSSPLSDFFEHCIEAADKDSRVKAADMQGAYVKYCDVQRIAKQERMNAKVLGQKLGDMLEKKHTETGWVYCGIRLVTNNLF